MTADYAVVIAGAGPTGMMLAAELALAKVDLVIVERRASPELEGARAGAGGFQSRTIEVLDQRGVAERFLAEGQTAQVQGFAGIRLDISDFPTRHNYGLALWQSHIERILAGWVDELGVPIARQREVTSFIQDYAGVEVQLSDGTSLAADYLVGCDGGRSVIRRTAGIDFPGWEPTTSFLIFEVETAQQPPFGVRREGGGIGPAEDGRVRAVLKEQQVEHAGPPTIQDVRDALVAACGTDFGVHSPRWISRFTDVTRQAASYRKGRVLLAGDAAHIHPPQGGQGLNTGMQDAVNLGWKLAQVVHGTSPDSLLDTYHTERHAVAARVLRNTMAQVAIQRPDERTDALRDILTDLLGLDEPRKRIAGMMSGLDIHYDLGDGHPLIGRRMPDLDLVTIDGPCRMFSLLHEARPVLLNLATPGSFDITPWANRVCLVDARYEGVWELPVLGRVSAPAAVLIRPDGYVAWAGGLSAAGSGLAGALTCWFGPPAQESRVRA